LYGTLKTIIVDLAAYLVVTVIFLRSLKLMTDKFLNHYYFPYVLSAMNIVPVSHGKIAPQRNRRGGDLLTDGDRETFAHWLFIHDRRL